MLSTDTALLLAMNHDYLLYYNNMTVSACVCDPGFLPDGMSCKPSICQAWTSCDRDDIACVNNAVPTPLPPSITSAQQVTITYNQTWVSKKSVVARSVMNMTTVAAFNIDGAQVSNGILTITRETPTLAVFDGVVIDTGDRVLIMNQVRGQDNGIYVYQSDGVTFIRASDADSVSKLNRGAQVVVDHGLTYARTMWSLQPPPGPIIGITPVIYKRDTDGNGDAPIYQIFNNTKYWIAGPGYSALGQPAYTWVSQSDMNQIPGVPYDRPWVAECNGAIYQIYRGQKYWLSPDQYARLGYPGVNYWAVLCGNALPNAATGPVYNVESMAAPTAQMVANSIAPFILPYTTFVLDHYTGPIEYFADPRGGYWQRFGQTRNYLDSNLYVALGQPPVKSESAGTIDPWTIGIAYATTGTNDQRAQVLANVVNINVQIGAQVWLQSNQSPVNAPTPVPPVVYQDGYTTSQLCAATMFVGSTIQRGTCAVTSIANVPTYACACASGYGGPDCGMLRCSWANGQVCAGNGACNVASNRCICNDGWIGMSCEIISAVDTCHQKGQILRGNPAFVGNPLGETPIGQFSTPDMLTTTQWY